MKSPHTTKHLTFTALSLLFATGIGCASHENVALDRARLNVQNAQSDPLLTQNASLIVHEAALTYDRADDEWHNHHDRDETDHLVYLTERTLQIARDEAQRKMALQSAQLQRDTSRVAAGSLRAEANQAHARANLNEVVAEHYRHESEQNRILISALNIQVLSLQSRETERGLEFTLSEGVLFETNKSDLKSGAVMKLSPLTEFLKNNPSRLILVEGHTDSVGSEANNRRLSQARAEAVQAMFVNEGIDQSRIVAKGLGKAYPVTSNRSEAGRLQNRRVQIVLLQPKP